jgi:hypothetical protein
LEDIDGLDQEINERLKKWQGTNVFPGGTQIAENPADITDEIATRLILLLSAFPDSKNPEDSKAASKAEELLTQAANKPRSYRNGLFFLSADGSQLDRLREVVAAYQAWKSIDQDKDSLELTNTDKEQTAGKVRDFNNTVNSRLGETWSRLLVPQVKDPKDGNITWKTLPCPGDDKIRSVLKTLKDKELVYDQFSAFHLERELKRHFWNQKDHATTREVENAFGSYLFFPRLLHRNWLGETIRSGFTGDKLLCEFFGYAEAHDPDTKSYLGLCATTIPVTVTIGDSVLIKPDAAMAHVKPSGGSGPPSGPSTKASGGGEPSTAAGGGGTSTAPTPPAPKVRFYGSVSLDPDKVTSSVQKIVDEVLQHLSAQYGTEVTVTLDVEANNAEGFDEATVRTVSENATTLGFKDSSTGFEE